MEVEFASKDLEQRFLFFAEGTRACGADVARAYIRRVTLLARAENITVVRGSHGVRLHALKGKLAGRSAVDLQGRWRLIITVSGNTVRIEEVSNHYDD